MGQKLPIFTDMVLLKRKIRATWTPHFMYLRINRNHFAQDFSNSLFEIESLCSSAWFSSDSTSVYYQNNIGFIHANRKSFNGRETTTSVLSMGQAYIACFRNARICKLQAICGTPRVRTGRHISSEKLGNIPIHFVCQLLVVGNLATSTGTGMQQSQTLW